MPRNRGKKAGPCGTGCGRVTRFQENGAYRCKNCRKTPLVKNGRLLQKVKRSLWNGI